MRTAADYADRAGYDPTFLGADVPLPSLSEALRAKACRVDATSGAAGYELRYDHFSVVMNGDARLAFVAAVNLDAAAPFRHTREGGDRWFADPRLDADFQAGNEFYRDNPLDRGHLVRRADAAWGHSPEEADRASDDTFHFTNCSPQHEIFNQARRSQREQLLLWGNIEEYIAAQAAADRQRISIFNGPVFRVTDRVHRGLRVPREFWKIVVYARPDRTVRALGFLLSQEGLIANLPLEEFIAGPYRPYQVPIGDIETRTQLAFGALRTVDPLAGRTAAALEQKMGAVALTTLDGIIL